MRIPGRISWLVLITLCICIKIFSLFPAAVERYYARGFYPYISGLQRTLFGWIPFSIGDILYGIAGIYLLRALVLFVRALFKRKMIRTLLIATAKKTVFVALVVYVVFNSFWGLNYNRPPMLQQMGMSVEQYSTENIESILEILVKTLNGFGDAARADREALHKKRYLFDQVLMAYDTVKHDYPELRYRIPSVKPSLFGYVGNYLGFTGYYNPFTGEAQTNTTVPTFLQPFTTCHELGHQLGYAKENEANFAGFLAARSSPNPAFRYSVYFDMYTYAVRELYMRDTVMANRFRKSVNVKVKEDILTLRKFYDRYETPLEPFIRDLYGNYLRANEQPKGLRSYNEVIAMLLGYYRKYGHI